MKDLIQQQIMLNRENYMRAQALERAPTALYLGHEEWNALMHSVQEYYPLIKDYRFTGKGPEWRGMKLYQVREDNHIGFGVA